MKIKGFEGTSLLDYPKKISAVIFLAGCDFRCPYCHNPDLIGSGSHIPDIPLEYVLEKLKHRKQFIDGVVITGGEPTIHNNLHEIIQPLKKLGFPVKLDTNGYNPELLQSLFEKKLIDYVAMDVKSSLENYSKAVGKVIDVNRIKESIKLIIKKAPDYEFRTTVVPSLINEQDIESIAQLLKGSKVFYVNQFRSIVTYDRAYENEKSYDKDVLFKFKDILNKTIAHVEVRGI